jgi:hypothetical protein
MSEEANIQARNEAGQFTLSTEGLIGRELANAEAGFRTKKDDPPADEKTYPDTLDGVKEAARDLADKRSAGPIEPALITAAGLTVEDVCRLSECVAQVTGAGPD